MDESWVGEQSFEKHDQGMLILMCYLVTALKLRRAVFAQIRASPVQPVSETLDQMFVRVMDSKAGHDAFAALFVSELRLLREAITEGSARSWESAATALLSAERLVWFFDEPAVFERKARGLFAHKMLDGRDALDPEDCKDTPPKLPPQGTGMIRLPQTSSSSSSSASIPCSPPSTPSRQIYVRDNPSTPSTPVSSTIKFESKTDIYYGLRRAMLVLASLDQVVIVAGTSAKTFDSMTKKSSPVRCNVRIFCDIPLISQDQIRHYLHSYFTGLPADYVNQVATNFRGRAYFFFYLFLQSNLLPELRVALKNGFPSFNEVLHQSLAKALDYGREHAYKMMMDHIKAQQHQSRHLLGEVLTAIFLSNGVVKKAETSKDDPFALVAMGVCHRDPTSHYLRVDELMFRDAARRILIESSKPDPVYAFLGDTLNKSDRIGDGKFKGHVMEKALTWALIRGSLLPGSVTKNEEEQRIPLPTLQSLLGDAIVSEHTDPWPLKLQLHPVTECGTPGQLNLASENLSDMIRRHRIVFPVFLMGPDETITFEDEKVVYRCCCFFFSVFVLLTVSFFSKLG